MLYCRTANWTVLGPPLCLSLPLDGATEIKLTSWSAAEVAMDDCFSQGVCQGTSRSSPSWCICDSIWASRGALQREQKLPAAHSPGQHTHPQQADPKGWLLPKDAKGFFHLLQPQPWSAVKLGMVQRSLSQTSVGFPAVTRARSCWLF